MSKDAESTPSPLPARILSAGIRPFESVWVGIVLLTVLLVYSSIGSALPFVRESRLFEMTEFEWFNWWPFGLLAALLCINLTTVTLRKIPFNVIKLGVWMIHAGIVLMILSSWWYFAKKIEGDTPVIRRSVTVQTPAGETASFPALPGASATAGDYTFTVANVDPTWPILTGEHEGENAFSVSVMVTPTNTETEPFIRQMLAGYPQYTEDIIPGKGRAVKSTGEKLLDPALAMNLDLAPQSWYHLSQTHALYIRTLGDHRWSQLPMTGLPRFNDYAADPGRELWLAPGDPIPPAGGLDVAIEGFEDVTSSPATVTGFVRYANLQERLIRADADGSVAATLTLTAPDSGRRVFQLAETIPGYQTQLDGAIALQSVRSGDELQSLLENAMPTVRFTVGETVSEQRVTRTLVDDPALGFTPVGDTGFAYRVRLAADRLRMPGAEDVSATIVEITTPEDERFVRFVSADGLLIQDINTAENGGTERDTIDDRFTITYTPGSAPAALTLVVGPDLATDAALLQASTGAAPSLSPAPSGEPIELITGGSLVIHEILPSAKLDARPAIVPWKQRNTSAGPFYSLIKVQIEDQQLWLPYHDYVFDGPNFRYQGKFRYEPTTIRLASGTRYELLYARQRRPLPAPVALDDFHLESHVGGFSGATPTIRDWISDVRFQTASGWSEPVEIKTNHPGTNAGLSFYQARWDPPTELGGGLAFTGLGVGSRSGVTAMLASSSLSVAGMIYVFYIKPSIQRRRVLRALGAKAEATAQSAAPPAPQPKPQTQEQQPVETGA